jgi:hypothetical protein
MTMHIFFQIQQKDDIIDEYETELQRFKKHYEELLEKQAPI